MLDLRIPFIKMVGHTFTASQILKELGEAIKTNKYIPTEITANELLDLAKKLNWLKDIGNGKFAILLRY